MFATLLVSLVSSSAFAATFSAEDLVIAHSQGLTTDTTTRMAESVGTDGDTAVYLLRRGVGADTLTTWGYAVGEAERSEAARLGALPEAPPVITEVVWIEPRALDLAIQDELSWVVEAQQTLPRHVVLRRRGNTSVAMGALLSVAGGMTFLLGAGKTGDLPPAFGASDWIDWSRGTEARAIATAKPNPILMGAGLGAFALGGVTVSFGANQLRLADRHPRMEDATR